MARPSTIVRHRRIQKLGWAIAVALMLVSGCTFDSSLRSVRCDQEGERSEGRLCQNGHWISQADTRLDADSPDVAQDTTPDSDADACPQGQMRCQGQCVDTQNNESHCGACGQPCNTYGAQSIALCAQGVCERTCQEGYVDLDGDWVGTDDPSVSNGCEVECAPTNNGEEICDGADNDCDGAVDEGVKTTYYLDADDDGFGVIDEERSACAPDGNFRATAAGDCDDNAASVNPGAIESCNGFDDDCDGDTDEECPCNGSESTSCYTGPQGTDGVGLCALGTKTCNGSGEWDACRNEVTPVAEVCDDGDDNDCDGLTDCEDDDCAAQSCGGGGQICHNNACCTPQSDTDFCTDRGAQCGQVSGTDNCGVQRTDVNCGGCGGGASCSGNTCHEDSNKCGDSNDNDNDGLTDCADDDCDAQSCAGGGALCYQQTCCEPEDDATLCSDAGAACGSISVTDSCGQSRSIDCGGCGGGTSCSSNSCIESNCDDGNDNDGDGDVDCFDSDCAGSPITYYFDDDDDGFGLDGDTLLACSPDGKYTATQGGDCQDSDSAIYPGAQELCDNDAVDYDCDTQPAQDDADADAWCGDPNGGGYGHANCVLDSLDNTATCCANQGGICL